MAFISHPGNTGNIVLRLAVEGEEKAAAAIARTQAQLKAIEASQATNQNKYKQMSRLEQSLQRDIAQREKTIHRSAKSLLTLSRSTEAFSAMGGGLLKILKLQTIEFGLMTVALGALRIALVAGRAVMKAFHASLIGIGAAAGVAVAAISTVLGAMQQLQITQMKPMFAGVYASLGDQFTPQTMSRSATGLTRNMMGDPRFGMFSEKALQQVMSARLQRGQQVGGSFRNDLARYGDYTGGDEKALTAISEAMAEAEKRGKVTADVYSMLVKSSPVMKAAFEEIAGGEKQAAAAAQRGSISFQQFHAALIDGKLKALEPYKGSLDEINKTIIGRFKAAVRVVKSELTGLSMTSANEAYGSGTKKTMLDAVAAPIEGIKESLVATITAIGPALRNVAPNLFTGIDGMASHMTERLTFYIVKGMEWLDGFSLTINRYIGNIRDFFVRIGQYLTQVTEPFSRLWQTFVKPLIVNVLGAISDEFRSFGSAVDDQMSTLQQWASYLPQVRDGFKALWEAGNVIKRIMSPIVTMFLQLGAALGNLFMFGSIGKSVAVFLVGFKLLSMAFQKAWAAVTKWRFELVKGESTLVKARAELDGYRQSLEMVNQALEKMASLLGITRPGPAGGGGRMPGGGMPGGGMPGRGGLNPPQDPHVQDPTLPPISPHLTPPTDPFQEQLNADLDKIQSENSSRWANFRRGAGKFTGGLFDRFGAGGEGTIGARFGTWAKSAGLSLGQRISQRLMQKVNADIDAIENGTYQEPTTGGAGFWRGVGRGRFKRMAKENLSGSEGALLREEEKIQKQGRMSGNLTMGAMMAGGMIQQYGGNNAVAQIGGGALSGAGMGGMTAQMLGVNTGVGVLVGGGLYAGQALQKSTPKTNKVTQALGGAMSGMGAGAAGGAMIGTMFGGPAGAVVGAGIGAGVGAIAGGIKGLMDAQKAAADAEKARADSITDIGAKGGSILTKGQLAHRMRQLRAKLPDKYYDDIDTYQMMRRNERLGQKYARMSQNSKYSAAEREGYRQMGLTYQGNNINPNTGQKWLSDKQIADLNAFDNGVRALRRRGAQLASEFSSGQFFGFKPAELAKYAARHKIDLSKVNLSIEAMVKLSGYSMAATDALANWALAGKRYVENITGFLQTTTTRAQAGIDRRRVVAEFGRTAQADRDQGITRTPEERLVNVNTALEGIVKDQGGILASGGYGKGRDAYQKFKSMVQQQMFSLVSRGQERFSPEMQATLQWQVQSLLNGGTPDNPGVNDSLMSQMAYNPELVTWLGDQGSQFVNESRGLKGKNLQTALNQKSLDLAEKMKTLFGVSESKEQIAAELKKKLAGSLTRDGEEVSGKIRQAMIDGSKEFASYVLEMSEDGSTMKWVKGGGGGKKSSKTDPFRVEYPVSRANGGQSSGEMGLTDAAVNAAMAEKRNPQVTWYKAMGYDFIPGDPLHMGRSNPDTGAWETVAPYGDTSTSRFGRTLAAHAALSRMVPGRRFMTSGLRNYALGSMSSDHLTGRAYDLTGDNLGTYARNVNALGGFAEFHGAGGGRHLHVVPPVGDTAGPVGLGMGGTHNYSIVVNAADGASAGEIANEVMARIARKQRDAMERA